MQNVNRKNAGNKKKGCQPGGDLVDRILDRRLRLMANHFDYRTFARTYGFTLGMVTHAIHETRKSKLARQIQKAIATLELPSDRVANREM